MLLPLLTRTESWRQLRDSLRRLHEVKPSLVYAYPPNTMRQVLRIVGSKGAKTYHGGMPHGERRAVHHAFIRDEVQVRLVMSTSGGVFVAVRRAKLDRVSGVVKKRLGVSCCLTRWSDVLSIENRSRWRP